MRSWSLIALSALFLGLAACGVADVSTSGPGEAAASTEEQALKACTPADCGPPLKAPTCLCPDGSLGCNTNRCIRDREHGCAWEYRVCPPR